MIHKTRQTSQKIARRLELIAPLVHRERHEIPPFRYTTLPDPMDTPPVGADVNDAEWPTIEPRSYWGQWMTDFTLRANFQIPADWDPNIPVALHLPLGESGDFSHPEFLAYIDGAAYAACDRHHQEISLPEQWRDGKTHLLALHGWTGLGGWRAAEPNLKLFMRPCAVVQIDQPTRDFIATARVALDVANEWAELDKNHPATGHLLNALDKAFKILDTRHPLGDDFYASVPAAHAALRDGIAKAGPPMDVDIIATGHAHIDVAWLWTLGQTRRKSGRTFHTVLRLMEQFPDYIFTQSQPQLYDYVRQDYPELFEAIKQRVAEGRWELTGGAWVENDCNITGPESLARQFLLGRAFYREHFGPDVDTPILWLPDVFGYSWALPQLIKQAGMKYFMTTKIGWNEYNRLPYDSFWWQGIDGTRVMTHFVSTPGGGRFVSTYNGDASPKQIIGTWNTFQQKETQQELLTTIGYGDGGGGPTREMLENVREMADFPATPRVRHTTAGEFFRKMEADAGEQLPTWNGELYLEYHRGTYTTHSRNKRANRKNEFLLHDAEFLCTWAALLDDEETGFFSKNRVSTPATPAYQYPHTELRKAWELVCLNQFHDIIPGSSITPVYTESLEQYADVKAQATAARDAALAIITAKTGGDLLLINPATFTRGDLAFWPGQLADGQCLLNNATPLPTQSTATGTWIDAGALPPFSATPLTITDSDAPITDTGLTATPTLLENTLLRVELDADGDITRIHDKANQREILPAGTIANQFQAFEDRPINFDAWDVDIFFDDTMSTADPAASIQVIEAGPLRATLEIKRRIMHSDTVQRISLSHNSPRLDFDTTIDWQERSTLLKVAFPVDILSPVATFEIQWGNVQRPTHHNTSWDWARFETCAQKWVDLSESDYGVSLLNDCKYGHDIRDNVMRISLLRGTNMPDPVADYGEHHFTYSLLPHTGPLDETTIAAAYALNDPLIVANADRSGRSELGIANCEPQSTFLSADRPNIVIETIKQAEDGDGVIVRLYESQRQRGPVTLNTGFDLAAAWRTNLLEENQSALELDGNSVTLSIKPYEIVTLRLTTK